MCRFACNNKEQYVASYDVNTKSWVSRQVTYGGISETNCYFVIGLGGNKYSEIVCTPTQEFYLLHKHTWVPAYQLHVGDILLGQDNHIPITHITFVKKPLAVYSIAIKETHTFAVGQHAVLTHNMILPMAFSAGLSIPFGTAATGRCNWWMLWPGNIDRWFGNRWHYWHRGQNNCTWQSAAI